MLIIKNWHNITSMLLASSTAARIAASQNTNKTTAARIAASQNINKTLLKIIQYIIFAFWGFEKYSNYVLVLYVSELLGK